MEENQQLEEQIMTNEQSRRMEILARIDELDRLADTTTDRATLMQIAERKKALRTALEKLLNT